MTRALLVAGVLLGGLAWYFRRRFVQTHVSRHWIDEHEWYQSRLGIEQSGIAQWPIDKRLDECGWLNAEKLRKRA